MIAFPPNDRFGGVEPPRSRTPGKTPPQTPPHPLLVGLIALAGLLGYLVFVAILAS